MSSRHVRFAIVDGGRKDCSAVHHADPIDSDDERRVNTGSPGDVSVHLGTYRGINGGPWKEEIDDEKVDVIHVPGTSVIVLLYDGKPQLVAHASEEGNRGAMDMAERFRTALERRAERKGPQDAPSTAQKRRAA